ncbi:MAG: hypothetical protein H7X80_09665 [bacterium]|nr:hypothetical protein [Candidatus Kapabacteria bacterium]
MTSNDLYAAVDWQEDYKVLLSIDRMSYRIAPALAAFTTIGAPESNEFFWGDGTARVGVATPMSEFSLLVPFAGGATAVGPLRTRRLAPGFGAAIAARYSSIVGRARFTTIADRAADAIRTIPVAYVHTLSAQALWMTTFESSSGPFNLSAGVGYEEYRPVTSDSISQAASRVRRISPVADLVYETPGRNYRVSVGVADMALRGSVMVQLSARLSLEARWVSNAALRDHSDFEHPFLFFLTPRITF